jgi:hypothetical protein
VFDMRDPAVAYFVLAFAQLAHEGLGPGRGPAELARAEQLGADREAQAEVFGGRTFLVQGALPPVELDLRPRPEGVRVQFVTPTEVKGGGEVAWRPEFGVLFGRIRDRVGTLWALYGAGPLEIDFRGMGDGGAGGGGAAGALGAAVDGDDAAIAQDGAGASVWGVYGGVEYEGEMGEFAPYLEAAQWTGVRRQTVWGKGVIEVEELLSQSEGLHNSRNLDIV